MVWSDYWGALTARQRTGLIIGAALIVMAMAGVAIWLLRDPQTPLAAHLNSEQLNDLRQNLDRAKLEYRIGEGGDSVWVSQSLLGKARAAAAEGQFGMPPNVGLELFKETDFSSTDFAQKINYQRALQGELTRTIQTISGVRSARVHVILADGGLFKRNSAKASAAVSVALQSGKLLTPVQVRGIQRLVAASVPEIKIDDVVVLDESGVSLTRATGEAEGELSSAQLDLKRQVDQYLESKVLRLLRDLVPEGAVSLSVDAVLDEKQLRVTTDEPIPAHGLRDAERSTGVLVKERQSQRGHLSSLISNNNDTSGAEGMDRELEYAVGHRMEQALSAPGSIRHISVAVALKGVPSTLSSTSIEQLVANAVGIEHARGDSVTVMIVPESQPTVADESVPLGPTTPVESNDVRPAAPQIDVESFFARHEMTLAAIAMLVVALLLGVWWARRRAPPQIEREPIAPAVDVAATTAKVRAWLNAGASSNHA